MARKGRLESEVMFAEMLVCISSEYNLLRCRENDTKRRLCWPLTDNL